MLKKPQPRVYSLVLSTKPPQQPNEYILGFVQNPALFLPEHFRLLWLDQQNGILAIMSKTKSDPSRELYQAILFSKEKWTPETVKDWLTIHPDYKKAAVPVEHRKR